MQYPTFLPSTLNKINPRLSECDMESKIDGMENMSEYYKNGTNEWKIETFSEKIIHTLHMNTIMQVPTHPPKQKQKQKQQTIRSLHGSMDSINRGGFKNVNIRFCISNINFN